jgi:hypothetical protein
MIKKTRRGQFYCNLFLNNMIGRNGLENKREVLKSHGLYGILSQVLLAKVKL